MDSRSRFRILSSFSVASWLFVALFCGACSEDSPVPETLDSTNVYTYQTDEQQGGTGKYYLGREISEVMGHRGAEWLDRPSRDAQELPDRLVNVLGLEPDDVVADIGAGTGYLTFRISPKVPQGRVAAVDIQSEMLEIIRGKMEEQGVTNIDLVKGAPTDPNLPRESIDVVLMVDSYHEFSHPFEMMTNIVEALKPGGRVVLVEYRGEDPTIPIQPLHRMTEEQARREMNAVGLMHRETVNVLPQQHVMVFEKPLG